MNMKTAGEIIKFLNENKEITVYELSESFGLSSGALRKRLISLGYTQNSMGEWKYNGKLEEEPRDEVVTGKRMKRKRKK
ncbi:winged helix-turn-helix domain-containing protein [Geobacillus sp. 47C-IIb]|uniref:winged helix-turn-helix domain-containing protein n=1 Tax=Geobacillus sp. 47C-IIb TaxID=1963026 RepID=UPI0016818E4D|nr:winged helix-turn-helix domain-containing protein [Geobacillus sp. 47C-IIb]QNU32614.1 winged helix-turn-helix domain-containing protein [Geobacillus sp. 47C-IIb]